MTNKDKEIDKIIGTNLRRLRIKAKMNQQELAEKIGITFQQIQKYELGTNRISGSRFYAFCFIFNVNPLRFFEGLPSLPAERVSEIEPQFRKMYQIVQNYKGTSYQARIEKQIEHTLLTLEMITQMDYNS